MVSPTAWYHAPGEVQLITPCNSGFVDTLKREIPAAFRSWNPIFKAWYVRTPYCTQAVLVLLHYFPAARINDEHETGPNSEPGEACRCGPDHRTLHVCGDAPPEVVKAAYHAMAKLAHPDAGGGHDRMRGVNAADERLTAGGQRS